jgi:hypothetical protein
MYFDEAGKESVVSMLEIGVGPIIDRCIATVCSVVPRYDEECFLSKLIQRLDTAHVLT